MANVLAVQPVSESNNIFDRVLTGTASDQIFSVNGTLLIYLGSIDLDEGCIAQNVISMSGTLKLTVRGVQTYFSGALVSRDPNGSATIGAFVVSVSGRSNFLILIGAYDRFYSVWGNAIACDIPDSLNNYLAGFSIAPATSTIFVNAVASTEIFAGPPAVKRLLNNLGAQSLLCARASACFCAMTIYSIPCMIRNVLKNCCDQRKHRQRTKYGKEGYLRTVRLLNWAQCHA
jgi:hypothetical protein